MYLDAQDREAIAMIQQEYGVTSASDAIRFAIRIIATQVKTKRAEGEK